jgi:hypothetical protein
VADNGSWFGFRIASNTTAHKWFYSSESALSAYRPILEVTWSDKPDPPEDLRPDGNRSVSIAKPVLRFDYTDVSGDTDLASVNVQINATDVWTSPSFDSGEVASSEPSLDLAATAYAGLSAGSSVYWRVRVKDGAGLWSNWSNSARFQRTNKGTFTVNNPSSGTPTVPEPTPPLDWTLSGVTQKAYMVVIYKSGDPTNWLWTTGKVTGTTSVVTPPSGIIKNQLVTYTLLVRVWDTVDREGTPGDKAYYEITRDFTYSYDATVNPVTSLNGTADPDYPFMVLTWNRSTQPDEWAIVRDDEIIEDSIIGADLFVSGTSYTYKDKWVPGRQNHVWKVMAIVNHKQSSANPTFTGKVDPTAPWLTRRDGSDAVIFLNPSHDESLESLQAVLETMGNRPGILVTQAIRGYMGHMEGVFADNIVTGLTARTMRNRFRAIRNDPGVPLTLYLVDETVKIVAYNMTVKPMAHPSGVFYYAAFDFMETN